MKAVGGGMPGNLVVLCDAADILTYHFALRASLRRLSIQGACEGSLHTCVAPCSGDWRDGLCLYHLRPRRADHHQPLPVATKRVPSLHG